MADPGKVRIDVPDQTGPPPGPNRTGARAAGATEGAGTPEIRVVIVDDQAPFRSVARTVVSMIAGWRVVGEAETGEDGVGQVEEKAPHLVLMDINLPGISGIEATRRIVAAHAGTAVVLLSTYAAEDLPADASSCGATGYIRKDDLTPRLLKTLLPG